MSSFHLDTYKLDRSGARMRGDGSMVVPARMARAGVQMYYTVDGEEYPELRHPDDVLAPAFIEAMGGIPLTLNHPPEMVTPGNAKTYAVGSVSLGTYRDGSYVAGDLIIHDAAAQAAVLNGTHRELSAGYYADVVPEVGEWNGVPYKARQTNHKHNHMALVERGRAGSAVRAMIDSIADRPDALPVMVAKRPNEENDDMSDTKPTATLDTDGAGTGYALVTIDGIQRKMRIADAELVKRLSDERDAEKARADKAEGALTAAEAEVKKLEDAKPDLDAVRKDVRAELTGRMKLEHLAKVHADHAATDKDTDHDLRGKVVKALDGGFNVDQLGENQLKGVMDYLVARQGKANKAHKDLLGAIDNATKPSKMTPGQERLAASIAGDKDTK